MSKFPRKPKIDNNQSRDLIIDFCEAIAATKSSQEAAQLLTDLLGKQELGMLARRLKIASMLLDDFTYEEIKKVLKVSQATIARVQVWLQTAGDGYRLVIERTKKKSGSSNPDPFGFSRVKKKYPMYFWPKILLDEWAKSASKKHKDQMLKILTQLEDKPKVYKELESLLRTKNSIV